MNRFFGMMPSSEIEIEKTFDEGDGTKATIQAGKNGWTVLYCDSSSEYKDVVDTTENNFNKAVECLRSHFKDAKEISEEERWEERGVSMGEISEERVEDTNKIKTFKEFTQSDKDILRENTDFPCDEEDDRTDTF